MADITVDGRKLTVTLEWWEKLAAHRSHLSVPLRAVTGVAVVDDVFADPAVASGRRAPATRLRGLTVTGTLDDPDGAGPVFVACHGAAARPRPGVAFTLDGVTVGRIVVSTPDAVEYARTVAGQTGLSVGRVPA